MMTKQRDIVLISVPFSDLRGRKVRPAVILSNDYFNRESRENIMIPMTSIVKEEPYSVFISQKDMESGKLIKPSIVRLDKIFSAEKELIIKTIGRLNKITFKKIKRDLLKIL